MISLPQATKDRLYAAARRAAAADPSDPFVLARALSHIGCGVATVIRGEHSRDYDLDRAQTAFYTAEPHTYERTVPGVGKFPAVTYRNISRP